MFEGGSGVEGDGICEIHLFQTMYGEEETVVGDGEGDTLISNCIETSS